MAWTVASQPFAVLNPNCCGRRYRVMSSDTVGSKAFAVRRRRVSPTATVFLVQCRERGTVDPGHNVAEDVAFGHDAARCVEETSLDVLWA